MTLLHRRYDIILQSINNLLKMRKCHIKGCGSKKGSKTPNLTFHILPKNNTRRMKWLEIIGVDNILNDSSNIYICSLHFDESSFSKTSGNLKLGDEALPSLHLPSKQESPESLPGSSNSDVCSSSDMPIDTASLLEEDIPLVLIKPKKKAEKSSATTALPGTSNSYSKKKSLTNKDVAQGMEEYRIPMRYVIDIAPKPTKKAPMSTKKRKLDEKFTKQQKEIKRLQNKLLASEKELAALKNQMPNDLRSHGEIVIVPMEEEG